MGTDVHMIVERRFGEKWIGVWASDYLPEGAEDKLTKRHYMLFNALAAVRGDMDGPGAKGLPDDVSDLARTIITDQGYHSATWWSLADTQTIYNKPEIAYVGETRQYAFADFVDLVWSEEDAEPFRVIFAFDS